MFTTFLKELGGYFDRHWLLSVFFPSLGFWAAGLLVVVLVKGPGAAVGWLQTQTSLSQTFLLAGALAWVAFFAFLLGNFQTALIRLYEGYWQTFPLSLLRGARLRYYRRRFYYLKERTEALTEEHRGLQRVLASGTDAEKRRALENARKLGAYERERLLFLPAAEEFVKPTRLGNIIRAAEIYPWKRYEIDAVVMWPRLHTILPKEFLDQLLGAKTAMTFMLMMSALSFTFAVVASTALALFTPHWRLFLTCALGVPLSWLCYRNALHGAGLYAELIKTAFDLHRWKLLEALGVKAPPNYDEELVVWKELTHLVYRGEPLTVTTYRSEPTTTEKADGHPTLAELVTTLKGLFQSPQGPAAGQTAAGAHATAPARADGAGAQAAASTSPPPSATPAGQTGGAAAGQTSRPVDYGYLIFSGLYVVIFGLVAFLVSQRPTPTAKVLVAAKDLPAYHLFTAGDFQPATRSAGEVTPAMLTDEKEVVGSYTLGPVTQGEPLNRGQMLKPSEVGLSDNPVVVGIPATQAMSLGGDLKPGDVVDITIVPAGASAQPPRTFEGLLVLGVKQAPVAQASQAQQQPVTHPLVLNVALPAALKQDFAAVSAGAQLQVARRPR